MSPEASTVGGDQLVEELRRELAEAREQQAATTQILRIISSSPTDLPRVFTEIAASAARLCDAYDAVIRQVDGEALRLVAHHGPIPISEAVPLSRGVITARAILDRRTIQVADMQAETDEYPETSDIARRVGYRTSLTVPLIRAGEAFGAIAIRRTEVRPFTDGQIALLKTFADQAVIAIENTRLFEAEQARTRELSESLERQTATSDILNVISRSPTDVQPVFDTIAANAVRLCDATFSMVGRFDGKLMELASIHNLSDFEGVHALRKAFPRPPRPGGANDEAILTRTICYIPDVWKDPKYQHQGLAQAASYRSILSVPILRHGTPIGTITVTGASPEMFNERQIELLKTFADQAVIAIENTRLFEAEKASKSELKESLEYQKATSDVV